jgi:D-alanyl-lipoteichoic acid acyltransferase DltB (MBOAT superfamily)
MLFNSLEFLVFFPVAVGVYYATPGRQRWIWLLAASYFFYGWWEPAYLLLILASTLVDYAAGRAMGRRAARDARRPFLLLSIASNLGLLFAFKYLGFFSRSAEALLAWAGAPASVPTLDVLLPVGISFYTFQTLAYSIDVYRGQQAAEQHLGYFALYVSFWPQLVAGPIERSQSLLPQFREAHTFNYDRVASGLKLMTWGMFKKVVIADRLAVFVDAVYNSPGEYAGLPVIIATYFFAFQIYCDFSGYSDIAIGAARVMGIDLMDNFRRPYFSKSIGEFWRRWHISLSTWFRDYLYIPLGGNRVSKVRWLANLMIVFVVSGLWHGAAWTFVIWGGLHGMYLIVGILTQRWRNRAWATVERAARRWMPAAEAAPEPISRAGLALPWRHLLSKRLPVVGRLTVRRTREAVAVVITFHLVLLAWVFFRAPSFAGAMQLLSGMVNWSGGADFALPFSWVNFYLAVGAIGLMETVHLLERGHGLRGMSDDLPSQMARAPVWVRWPVYFTVGCSILLLGWFEAQEFIYFQF